MKKVQFKRSVRANEKMLSLAGITLKKIFFSLFVGFFLSGCSSDPNDKANKLYVKAIHLNNEIIEKAKTYADTYDLYKNSHIMIENIVTNYPSSDIAVRLASNEKIISGLSLREFKDLDGYIKLMVEAELDPTLKSLMVSNSYNSSSSDDYKSAREKVIYKVAHVYASSGMEAQALKIANLLDADSASKIMDVTLEAYTSKGDLHQAERLVDENQIYNTKEKNYRYGFIAAKYSEAGRFAEALRVVDKMETRRPIQALIWIANNYSTFNKNDEARELLRQVEELDKKRKRRGLDKYSPAGLAVAYALAGDFNKSIGYLEEIQIKHHSQKFEALLLVANRLIIKGHNKKASKLLLQALEISKSYDLNHYIQFIRVTPESLYDDLISTMLDLSYVSDSKYELSKSYVKMGEFQKAFNLVSTIKKPRDRYRSFVNLSDYYADLGENDNALQMLDSAHRLAFSSEFDFDERFRGYKISKMMVDISARYRSLGRHDLSTQIVSMGLGTDRILIAMIGEHLLAGETSQAEDIVYLILERNEDSSMRNIYARDILKEYARTGYFSRGSELIDGYKQFEREDLILIYIDAGLYAEAESILDEVRNSFYNFYESKGEGNYYNRLSIIIANNYIKAGYVEKAKKHLNEIVETASMNSPNPNPFPYPYPNTITYLLDTLIDARIEPRRIGLDELSVVLESPYPPSIFNSKNRGYE